MHRKYTVGFTIVELLVSIVVISILAGVAYAGYENYEQRAQSNQVASTISAYRQAVRTGVQLETDTTPSESYTQDGDFLAACITTNSDKCCFYYYLYQGVMCKNNTELKAAGLLDTDFTYNIVQKYVPGKKAKMPNFNTYGGTLKDCSEGPGSGSTSSPFEILCYSNQIAYTTGQLQSLRKGYLNYYLPSSFDSCYSDKVIKFPDDDPLNMPQISSTAKYTARVTTGDHPFTYCMVAIDGYAEDE